MLFSFFHKNDINSGVEEFRNTAGAVLLDVRTQDEYNERHIEGSINIPLDVLHGIEIKVPDKSTPVYVHCLSGGRSARAAALLRSLGYTDIKDIGGIGSYKGKTVKG